MSVSQKKAALGVAAKRAKRVPSAENAELVQDARRALAAAKLEAYVAEIVGASPKLSADQVRSLSALLQASVDDKAGRS